MKRMNRKICMALLSAVLLTSLENASPVCASSEISEAVSGEGQDIFKENTSDLGEVDETAELQGSESFSGTAIGDVTVGVISDQLYTGKKITPDVQLIYGGEELVRDRDYTLEYKNNVNVGIAMINISGIGNYTGTRTETFRITQADISNVNAVLGSGSCVYTGKACQVGITLKYNGMTLVQGRDYSVRYQDNVKAGTAIIKATGQNNYTGSLKKTFKITRRDASDVKIKSVVSQLYTGKAVTPLLSIVYAGKKLVRGTDYTVVYKNNVRLGKRTAKAEVRFKGNFKGSRSVRFSIIPASPRLSVKASSDTVRLKWKKAAKADGYRIYRRNRDNTKWIYLDETTDLSFTDKNRKQNTAYL